MMLLLMMHSLTQYKRVVEICQSALGGSSEEFLERVWGKGAGGAMEQRGLESRGSAT